MAVLPHHICDEENEDEETPVCTEVPCHSRYDSNPHRFQNQSCPVDTRFRPIKCIYIKNDTVVPPGSCNRGHDFGHNDSFIHVREGCSATFKACTDERPPPSPSPPPPQPPDENTPTTMTYPTQFRFQQSDDGNDDPNGLTIGLAALGGLIVIALVVMVMLYYRRQKRIKDTGNISDDNKKMPNAITSDHHDYSDITLEDDVGYSAIKAPEVPGDYVTIEDDVDKYDHCRHPPLDTEKHTGTTYDSLGAKTVNGSVINDEPYDTTRDTTYDRLHAKENKSSIPGNYDVLPKKL